MHREKGIILFFHEFASASLSAISVIGTQGKYRKSFFKDTQVSDTMGPA